MTRRLRPLVLLLLALGVGPRPAAAAAGDPDDVERWLDSVVLLVTGGAFCSGVVIDDAGTVATAYHCVTSGLRTRVRTRGDVEATGRTIAAAPSDDLALVSVPDLAGKVPPLAIREDAVRRGEAVWGLGHPYAPSADKSEAMEGMLLWSVSKGIVSAVGPKLIQTDAALNPGNSGGPVVDEAGRVVGITSRKINADNIAFAASAEALRALVEEPREPSILGGDLSVGLSWLGGTYLLGTDGRSPGVSQNLELTLKAALRDRLVLGGGLGLPGAGRAAAWERGASHTPVWEIGAAARQRFGRGAWTTTLEVGGGYWFVEGLRSDFDAERGTWLVYTGQPYMGPGVSGRVGLGGAAVRVVAVLDDPTNPLWLLGIDLDVPGVLTTF